MKLSSLANGKQFKLSRVFTKTSESDKGEIEVKDNYGNCYTFHPDTEIIIVFNKDG